MSFLNHLIHTQEVTPAAGWSLCRIIRQGSPVAMTKQVPGTPLPGGRETTPGCAQVWRRPASVSAVSTAPCPPRLSLSPVLLRSLFLCPCRSLSLPLCVCLFTFLSTWISLCVFLCFSISVCVRASLFLCLSHPCFLSV